jgi:sialate O-acetylesterase
MNTKMLRLAAVMIAAEIFLAGSGRADPSLSSVFGESMVLQRDRPIPVWGRADANEPITVSLNGKVAKTTADAHGVWMAKLPAMNAGGPCVLSITGSGKSLTLTNALFRDHNG